MSSNIDDIINAAKKSTGKKVANTATLERIKKIKEDQTSDEADQINGLKERVAELESKLDQATKEIEELVGAFEAHVKKGNVSTSGPDDASVVAFAERVIKAVEAKQDKTSDDKAFGKRAGELVSLFKKDDRSEKENKKMGELLTEFANKLGSSTN